MTALRLVGISLLLLAPLLRQPVAAQTLDPTFAPPTGLYAPGSVYALGPQQADGKRVVAGFFSRVNGAAAGSLTRLDASGATDQAFAQNVGTASNIYRVQGLAGGKYLLGANGGTVTAGGISRAELLRLNADGTADATFDAGYGPTATSTGYGYGQSYVVQPDGKIVVGGFFDSFSGVAAAGATRLNANGSVDTGFNVGTGIDVNAPSTYNVVDAVAVQADGKILLGGSFTSFNGQATNGLVRLNANGSVDASFTSPFAGVTEPTTLLVQPDGKILVGGYLMLGTAYSGVVRLNPNGSLDSSFNSTTVGSNVSTFNDAALVLQPDGKILVTGYLNISTNPYVARLNADGTLDTSFQTGSNPGPSSAPTVLGLQADGRVLTGGSFSFFNGLETSLGRFTSSGTPDATFTPKLQQASNVLAVVRQADGRLIIGGSFSEVNGQAAHRVARLAADGTVDASFSAAMGSWPGTTTCLAIQPDGKLLVGTNNGLLRFTTTGAPDASLAYFSGASVTALAVQPDGRILLGSNVVSTNFRYLVRLTSSGGLDATFARPITNSTGLGVPSTVGAVLVQPDGRIVVAEDFVTTTNPTVYTSRVVRYEASGALDTSFGNASEFATSTGTSTTIHRLYTLAIQADGKLLVGGNFGSVNGNNIAGLARLLPTGAVDTGFTPGLPLSSTVYSVVVQPNGRILLGGTFTLGSLNRLARLTAAGQPDASFAPTANPNSTVRTLLVQPDGGIVVGGSFTTLGGQPVLYIARITAPNVLAVAAPAAVAARTQAWPVPAHSVLHVAPDAGAQPRTLELLDGRGRTVRTLPLTSAAETALSVEGLPAGLYLLRVGYATGTVTRAIAVE